MLAAIPAEVPNAISGVFGPLPPAPPTNLLWAAGIGSCVAGLILLLWGRKGHKLIIALATAAAAAALAPETARRVAFDHVLVVGVASAVICGLVAYLISRPLWMLLLGLMLSAAAVATLAVLSGTAGAPAGEPGWGDGGASDFAAWLIGLRDYLLAWLYVLWDYNPVALSLAAAAPLALGIAVGIFYPQAMHVFTSSLVGAVLLVAGAGACTWAAKPEWLAQWAARPAVVAGIAGALLLVGLLFQGRSVGKKKKPGKEPPVSGQPKAPGKPPEKK